jgi:hypothetical protein
MKFSTTIHKLKTSQYYEIKRLPNRRKKIKFNFKIYIFQFLLWILIVAAVGFFNIGKIYTTFNTNIYNKLSRDTWEVGTDTI